MDYASITFKDRNPVKRWLQKRRLFAALRLAAGARPAVICDFGAGNGELLKLLSPVFPEATLICYEPTPRLLEEARQNLKDIPRVRFTDTAGGIDTGSVDMLCCLEVFEHLPLRETADTLAVINRVLSAQGTATFGLPVEIGIPALYKGLFRMTRRFGDFDANFSNVFAAVAGHPPAERPCGEIAPGFRYHFAHMGFDHRRFRKVLEASFRIRKTTFSPFPLLGAAVNPEVYFSCVKKA